MAKEPVPPPRQTKQYVRLKGDHLESGSFGWITLTDKKPETTNRNGVVFTKIDFPDGMTCYAEDRHIDRIELTSPPPPRKR